MSDAGTTTPAADASADANATPPADTTDWKSEFEKLQKDARKWEDRAKANATAGKELEQLRTASMSDLDKAVEVARNEARTETLRTVGARLVDAEVKAAAAGRTVDVEALLEGLDRSRFLDDEGEPNVKAITAWVDRIAPPSADKPATADLGQGNRGTDAGLSPGDDALLKAVVGKVGASGARRR